jgi:hypothetical protein
MASAVPGEWKNVAGFIATGVTIVDAAAQRFEAAPKG